MSSSWVIAIAIALILLKQIYKLYIYNKPDTIEILRAIVSLPLDSSFLVVSLFVRQALFSESALSIEKSIFFILAYIIISLFIALLWRVSDNQAKTKLTIKFFLTFSSNLVIAGTTLYLALITLR